MSQLVWRAAAERGPCSSAEPTFRPIQHRESDLLHELGSPAAIDTSAVDFGTCVSPRMLSKQADLSSADRADGGPGAHSLRSPTCARRGTKGKLPRFSGSTGTPSALPWTGHSPAAVHREINRPARATDCQGAQLSPVLARSASGACQRTCYASSHISITTSQKQAPRPAAFRTPRASHNASSSFLRWRERERTCAFTDRDAPHSSENTSESDSTELPGK